MHVLWSIQSYDDRIPGKIWKEAMENRFKRMSKNFSIEIYESHKYLVSVVGILSGFRTEYLQNTKGVNHHNENMRYRRVRERLSVHDLVEMESGLWFSVNGVFTGSPLISVHLSTSFSRYCTFMPVAWVLKPESSGYETGDRTFRPCFKKWKWRIRACLTKSK